MDNPETLATLGTQDKDKLDLDTIKNGQSRNTGNIRHTKHKTKTNKTKKCNTTQKIKKMINTDSTKNLG
jgi:hypothetical protein